MDLFHLTADLQTTNVALNSTHRNFLHLPPFKTMTYGKKSIRYQCPKIWNYTFKTGTRQIESDRSKDITLESIETTKSFKKSLNKGALSVHLFIN